jgi:hypothetical protein
VAAEPRVISLVESRKIRRGGPGALFVASGISGGTNLARDADGSCVFFDRDGGRLCVIHREAGAEALPAPCRHFPRTILRDARGTFMSLSHFCPTAAAMLLAWDPLEIVEAKPPLRLEDPIEGMDAVNALPPLLRPGLLTDLEGYAAWERACVKTFARPELTYRQALDLVAAATEATRTWQPGVDTLAASVETAFHEAVAGPVVGSDADARAMETAASLLALPLRPSAPWLASFDVAMKNYLAARVFANWIAYQGRGLRSIVEWLRICAALVRHHAACLVPASGSIPGAAEFMEAVRLTDHLLLHVVETSVVARRIAPIEGSDPR